MNSKEKTIAFILTIILMTLTVAGCSGGSYTIIKGAIDHSDHSMTGSYTKFNGYYFKKVKLEEGQKVNLKFLIITEEGELTAEIDDSSGKTILQLNGEEDTQEKEVVINKTDKYRIKVIGDEHNGSFQLHWEVE